MGFWGFGVLGFWGFGVLPKQFLRRKLLRAELNAIADETGRAGDGQHENIRRFNCQQIVL